jgi:DNA replication protein DnaC
MHLERLKLKRVADLLDPISEQATKESLSYLDFLDRLLEAEAASRAERRLLAKTRLAHFPFQKTRADFDFSYQPSIDRKQSRSSRHCAFSPTARTSSCLVHQVSAKPRASGGEFETGAEAKSVLR